MADSTKIDVRGKEWTVMFFFAADNSLSPLVVSQVKAIKHAGYQADTNVLVHFDPSEENAPTRVYHVNRREKEDRLGKDEIPTLIGDGASSFVPNSFEDFINAKEIEEQVNAGAGPSTKAMFAGLADPDDVSAAEALDNFIGYSMENFPAKHYILFLVGHGMIVGNDAFLPDDSNDTGITLLRLNKILERFAPNNSATTLELLAMHSCSMSSVEVAYELKGKAKYMMACQGSSYVGSWPYRHLMKKIFNVVNDGNTQQPNTNGGPSAVNVKNLVTKLYRLSVFNSPDFSLAGYSADLSLCSLQEDRVNSLTVPLQTLVRSLKQGIKDKNTPVEELIQLAHLKSQSYWAESYTDLYDFCRCLLEAAEQRSVSVKDLKDLKDLAKGHPDLWQLIDLKLRPLEDIKQACRGVMTALETEATSQEPEFKGLVLCSDHLGPMYQYSHGLSIYFPWTEQLSLVPKNGMSAAEARKRGEPKPEKVLVMENYKQYQFTRALPEDSWASFLDDYFAETMRDIREVEDGGTALPPPAFGSESPVLEVDSVEQAIADGELVGGGDGKPNSTVGQPFVSTMIKNFHAHMDETTHRKRRDFSVSPGARGAFKPRIKTAVPKQSSAESIAGSTELAPDLAQSASGSTDRRTT